MLSNNTVKGYLYTGMSAIGVLSSVAFNSPTLAAIATFDSFSEGLVGTTVTDGGITFSDLDQGLSDFLPYTFTVDSTTEDSLDSVFSPPNYLTFGSFASGLDQFSFGPFSSTRITTGKVESSASLDLFSPAPFTPAPASNSLTLEAFLDGNLVASTTAALANFEVVGESEVLYKTLAIAGVEFNELRLSASGPDDEGGAFIGIDNVRISVPEPTATLGVLAVGVLGAASVLKRKQQSAE